MERRHHETTQETNAFGVNLHRGRQPTQIYFGKEPRPQANQKGLAAFDSFHAFDTSTAKKAAATKSVIELASQRYEKYITLLDQPLQPISGAGAKKFTRTASAADDAHPYLTI